MLRLKLLATTTICCLSCPAQDKTKAAQAAKQANSAVPSPDAALPATAQARQLYKAHAATAKAVAHSRELEQQNTQMQEKVALQDAELQALQHKHELTVEACRYMPQGVGTRALSH